MRRQTNHIHYNHMPKRNGNTSEPPIRKPDNVLAREASTPKQGPNKQQAKATDLHASERVIAGTMLVAVASAAIVAMVATVVVSVMVRGRRKSPLMLWSKTSPALFNAQEGLSALGIALISDAKSWIDSALKWQGMATEDDRSPT